MRTLGLGLVAAILVMASCGASGGPQPDGGAGGGDGGTARSCGIGGGGGAVYLWSAYEATAHLPFPPPAVGAVQRVALGGDRVYAIAGGQRFLQMGAGATTFSDLTAPQPLTDLRVARSGRVIVSSPTHVWTCSEGCEDFGAYAQFALPSAPTALCATSHLFAATTASLDGGSAVLTEGPDAGWHLVGFVNAPAPGECARTDDGAVFVAAEGRIARMPATGGATNEVPDTTALGRPSSQERWTRITTDGTSVLAASEHGALAHRDPSGTWQVVQALGGPATAVLLESPASGWAFDADGMVCLDASGWHSGGYTAGFKITSAAKGGGRLHLGGYVSDGGAAFASSAQE